MNPRAKAPFVKVPIWWAVQAAEATGTNKALVWIWLRRLSWKAATTTFPVPNSKLKKLGVSRWQKTRALRELEAAGLIAVEWRGRKTPLVTMLYL
jgi:hypothetical protein